MRSMENLQVKNTIKTNSRIKSAVMTSNINKAKVDLRSSKVQFEKMDRLNQDSAEEQSLIAKKNTKSFSAIKSNNYFLD